MTRTITRNLFLSAISSVFTQVAVEPKFFGLILTLLHNRCFDKIFLEVFNNWFNFQRLTKY